MRDGHLPTVFGSCSRSLVRRLANAGWIQRQFVQLARGNRFTGRTVLWPVSCRRASRLSVPRTRDPAYISATQLIYHPVGEPRAQLFVYMNTRTARLHDHLADPRVFNLFAENSSISRSSNDHLSLSLPLSLSLYLSLSFYPTLCCSRCVDVAVSPSLCRRCCVVVVVSSSLCRTLTHVEAGNYPRDRKISSQ